MPSHERAADLGDEAWVVAGIFKNRFSVRGHFRRSSTPGQSDPCLRRGCCRVQMAGMNCLPVLVAFALVTGSAACGTMGTSVRPSPPDPPAVFSSKVAEVSQESASPLADAQAISRPSSGLARDFGRATRQSRRWLEAKASSIAEGEADVTDGALAPTPPGAAAGDTQPKLVVTGAIELSTDDVPALAAAIRAEARRRGVIIVSDRESGAKYGISAQIQVRIVPEDVASFIDWLGTKGAVESSNLAASDVSREYFDQELRLRTLRFTLDRLEKILADRANVSLADVLSVEREMTRVRGEIEQLEGEHRYLADRVQRATLDVHVTAHGQIVAGAPEQKFILVARGTVLRFVDDGFRNRRRSGVGVGLMFGRRFDLGLDVFPARDLDDRSILFSMGGALYSDFLGGGRRRFGNPYLGFRLGAGSINNRSTLAYGAEVGVEVVRLKYLLVDLGVRAMGFYYNKDPNGSDITFQGVLGVGVPF
jgi:Domain of unknown function (DUF4349)